LKLGVNVGYWGFGIGAVQQLEIARTAEALGYDSIWTAEAYGSDSATVLAWLAAQTSRIKLGSGILQIPARSAAMTAMTAATIDQLSGGRLLLGLGTSGPQVSEGWHGVRFAKQLQRTREYVAVVRMALAHQKVEFHGETLDLPLPDGPGKALKLSIRPVQDPIPIYLAVLGPRNVALAGEIADGWLPVFFSPEHVASLRVPLEEGAALARRSLDDFRICPSVQVLISDDIAAARDAMRPMLSLYVGGMGSREQNFYNRLVSSYGFGAAARQVQDLYLTGKRSEAAAALPDELIDQVTIAGPRERASERIRAYRDAGVDTLIVSPMFFNADQAVEQLRLVAALNQELD
jgi:F420-dependent oxidoreductase-like protein